MITLTDAQRNALTTLDRDGEMSADRDDPTFPELAALVDAGYATMSGEPGEDWVSLGWTGKTPTAAKPCVDDEGFFSGRLIPVAATLPAPDVDDTGDPYATWS